MIQNAKIVAVGVEPQAYHTQEAKRGSVGFAMSPSQLKEFSKCPDRWVRGYEPPQSEAKDYGSLLDCRLLTPDLFPKRYAVRPATYTNDKGETKPFNLNSNVCKAWVEEQDGKEVISAAHVEDTDSAIARLNQDEVIAAFLAASDRQVLVVGEWHDDDTKLVVPIRCLIDLAPRKDSEFCKSLSDFKTTRSAALTPFQRQCYQMGWHIQAAFDTDLYVAASGEDRCNWCFIVQESYAPWQPAKRLLSHDFMELGRTEYRRILATYCACLKANQWPDYDSNDEAVQGWSVVRPEPFMESAGLFAPKLILPETETTPVMEEGEVTP